MQNLEHCHRTKDSVHIVILETSLPLEVKPRDHIGLLVQCCKEHFTRNVVMKSMDPRTRLLVWF